MFALAGGAFSVCADLQQQDSEATWKVLESFLDHTPALRKDIKKLTVIGDLCYYSQIGPVVSPDALGITPSAFPGLVELRFKGVSLPSVEHLVALVLSLPKLERLYCDQTTFMNPTEDRVPEDVQWYSRPLHPPRAVLPTEPRRAVLKTLHLSNSTSFNGDPPAPATDIFQCFMDASLHVALEDLHLISASPYPPAPSWIPLVRACAPTLHTLTLSFGGEDAVNTTPALIDALRELPRLRKLGLWYDAAPSESWDLEAPFTSLFLADTLALVRAKPVPFPALESLDLTFQCDNAAELAGPCYPEGTEGALHEILHGLLAVRPPSDRWEFGAPGDEQQRCYPCLKHFGFKGIVGEPREKHELWMARVQADLMLVALQGEAVIDVQTSCRYD